MRRCTVRGGGLRHSSGAAGSGVQDGGWWLVGCQERAAIRCSGCAWVGSLREVEVA